MGILNNKRGMLGQLIGAFVVILVGVSMVPIISEQLNIAAQNMTASTNVSDGLFGGGGSSINTMLNFVPMFFVLAIALAAIMMVYNALSSAGILGGSDYDGEDSKPLTDDEETVEALKRGNVKKEDYANEKKKDKQIREQEFKKIQEEKYKKMDAEINKIYNKPTGKEINQQMDKQIASDSNGAVVTEVIKDTKKFEEKNKHEEKSKYD